MHALFPLGRLFLSWGEEEFTSEKQKTEQYLKWNTGEARQKDIGWSPKLWEAKEEDRREGIKEKEREYWDETKTVETVFIHMKI